VNVCLLGLMSLTISMMDPRLSESSQVEREKLKKSQYRRNLASFWIFGLTNNFAYVVMLSAAHDILDDEENDNGNSTFDGNITTVAPFTTTSPSSNETYLECNPMSTGTILLADILPTLIVKMILPFYIQKIPYSIKISLISGFALSSFVLVALAHEVWLSVLGVVCASIGAGLGEITFLSLTTFYHRNVVSMWSSGTGGAGVVGAIVYAGFTSAGLSPRDSLLIMTCIPALLMVTYFTLLTKPELNIKKTDQEEDTSLLLDEGQQKKQVQLTMKEKLRLIPSLLKYMVPLTLVYYGEYFINQGLHELLYFPDQWLTKEEQYRWYQVTYQIGVFLSRSSVNLFQIQKLWLLPVLQFGNLALLLCQVFFRFIPSIWIVFAVILWEGLLGGWAYVNTFYRMTNEIVPEHREYCIGIATLGDSIGIAIAGATAIPSHRAICQQKIKL